ncbi:synergin gamma-like [Liolophura sinensis]|uniref:synergin gamma-like n=1 Tax=Liolophura sinensis TaxID=3198878 RepID=UPI0031588198
MGLPGFQPGGMDMMAGRFMQPMGGYPPGMMPHGAQLPTAAAPMRQPMYNMQPGFMPRMPMPMMTRPPIAPPAYSPQMAQNFRARHRTPEEIREQEDQLRKQRQYQEQRMKLQSFGRVGPAGRSEVNADRLIESMFGKAERPKQKPVASSTSNMAVDDDGFGDFMTAQPAAQPTAQKASLPSTAAQPPGVQPSGSHPTQTPHPAATAPQANVPVMEKKEQRPEKDLMSMMMECSDLTAPKQAKHFHQKKAIKSIVPTPHHTTALTHQQSQKSRNWGVPENLGGLFQGQAPPVKAPSGVAPSEQSAAPAETPPQWCHTPDALPPLYRQVEEAVTVDGKISTERLYPILLLSGLSREGLGHIWGLANRSTPGQLQPSELYMVLAMIALAQNNYNIPSLAILAQCPAPPIPYLGPNSQATPTPQQQPVNQQAQAVSQAQTVPVTSGGVKAVPGAGSTGIPTSRSGPAVLPSSTVAPEVEADRADMEFTDFQQGPATPAADDFGDFKAAEQIKDSPVSKPRSAVPSPLRLEDNLSPEEQHSNVTNFFCSDDSSSGQYTTHSVPTLSKKKGPTTPNSLDDYFFDDGKSGGSKISDSSQFSHSDLSEGEDFKNFDMYVEQFADQPSVCNQVTSPRKAKQSQRPNGGLGHVTRSVPPVRLSGGASPWGNASTAPHSAVSVTNLPQVAHCPQPVDDDFADFQEAAPPKSQPSELNLMGDENSEDKYAALRGWSVDEEKPAEPKSLLDTDSSPVIEQIALPGGPVNVTEPQIETDTAEDDWADFKDYSEFATTTPVSFPPSGTVAIETIVQPMKTDDGEPYFPPPMKTAHTNSSFPPMAMTDLPPNAFEQQDFHQKNVFDVGPGNGALPFLDTQTPTAPTKAGKSPSLIKDSPIDKELQAVDFDSSRVPPPMDFQEDAEDEFRDCHFGDTSPTLDPHSPTFETSFNQQHSLKPTTTSTSSSFCPTPKGPSLFSKSAFKQDIQSTVYTSDSDKSDVPGQQKEDSQSVSSLELGYVSQRNIGQRLAEPDSQSVNSGEFGEFESGGGKTNNPESKSVDSFDMQDETLGYGQGHDLKVNPESKSLDSLDLKKVDSREWSPDEGEDANAPQTMPQGEVTQSRQETDLSQLPVSAQTLLQNGTLPALGDRYSGVIQDVQGSDRHVFEWERCLESASHMISNANAVFNSISSSAVCSEIIQCGPGTDYLVGIVEIYRVVCRISLAMKTAGISSDKLTTELKSINLGWTNLTAFIATSPIMPDPSSLDYRIAILKSDDTASQLRACGVCLLNMDSRSKAFNEDKEGSKLTYGGRQYHTTCANFWVNCVSPMLPALRLPDLL